MLNHGSQIQNKTSEYKLVMSEKSAKILNINIQQLFGSFHANNTPPIAFVEDIPEICLKNQNLNLNI